MKSIKYVVSFEDNISQDEIREFIVQFEKLKKYATKHFCFFEVKKNEVSAQSIIDEVCKR